MAQGGLEPLVRDQPEGVEWPTTQWPTGAAPAGVVELVDAAFEDPVLAETYAVVVVVGGRLVAERYGGALPSFTHEPTPVAADTALLGWSMTKSVLHAAVGLLVAEGRFDCDERVVAPEWLDADPRTAITPRHLLQMRDGLAWDEDYVDEGHSDVIAMLYGTGQADVAAYAAGRPLAVAPGERFNYSSGSSNLLARALCDVVGRGDAVRSFLATRLFDPIGMFDATVGLDATGTFIGSSFSYATARSWARFATLYLRGGTWEGRELLARPWALEAQTPTSKDEVPRTFYTNHWWCDGEGAYWASGYRGQRAIVVPASDAVVIRLGDTPAERYGELRAWSDSVVAAVC